MCAVGSIAQPTLPASLYERKPSALVCVERGYTAEDVYDGMLVVHHLLQRHKVGIDLGETAVYLTCDVQAVACPQQMVGVFCVI